MLELSVTVADDVPEKLCVSVELPENDADDEVDFDSLLLGLVVTESDRLPDSDAEGVFDGVADPEYETEKDAVDDVDGECVSDSELVSEEETVLLIEVLVVALKVWVGLADLLKLGVPVPDHVGDTVVELAGAAAESSWHNIEVITKPTKPTSAHHATLRSTIGARAEASPI